MRIFCLAVTVSLVGFTPPQDDVEAKKKRLGEIFSQSAKLQIEGEKLLTELSGGNREKRDAIMQEVLEKYAPEMAALYAQGQTRSNERVASTTLKTLATAQADFRANDRDWNHVNDFWVGDVSGLYRIEAQGQAIKLIEMSAALADHRPSVPLENAGPFPKDPKTKFASMFKGSTKAGYYFMTVPTYEDEAGKVQKYDEGNGRNASMFGLCAFPAEYGKRGKMTFILNENNTIFRKDTGGKPVEVWPQHPVKAGWELLD